VTDYLFSGNAAHHSACVGVQLLGLAREGMVDSIAALVAAGAEVDCGRDETALAVAARHGHTATVTELVRLRASVNTRNAVRSGRFVCHQ
jgi:hypothetical protein